ncbi:hypothetical protein FSP39_004175 [Pinctada imbricata]|uniref:Uncharacterized protein n=1 Tax=Pinctada imbricata TaxID=66713 RepID=A0AA88YHD7_PINIB|nr:hypothetical protein FSP39_004175 [Pinctada imbricata]
MGAIYVYTCKFIPMFFRGQQCPPAIVVGRTSEVELCQLDSDGDGRTNGQELGDPDCLWSPGNDSVLSYSNVTHPAICEPLNDTVCEKQNKWLHCDHEFKCDGLNDPDVQHFDIRLPKSKVSAKETTYICIILDVPTDGDYHIIGNTPIVDNTDVLHHILLYGCNEKDRKVKREVGVPYDCGMTPGDVCGRELIGVWTSGVKGECLHPQAGFRMGTHGYKRMALQVHWNNPYRTSGHYDSSGLRLYYTSNRRPNDAGILWVGQQYLEIPPSRDRVVINGTCSGDCTTAMFSDKISVFGAMNHMHLLGREQRVMLYRGGKYLHHITDEGHYSFNRPSQTNFPEPVQVLPGDELRTSCVFDSSRRRSTTLFGEGTDSEMCFTFIKYFPKENIPAPMCLAFKDLQLCEAMSEYKTHFPNGLKGCDFQKFASLTNPETLKLIFTIKEKCKPFHCLQECKSLLLEAKNLPCLHGDVWEFLKFYLLHEEGDFIRAQGEEAFARFTSCDLEIGIELGQGRSERNLMTTSSTTLTNTESASSESSITNFHTTQKPNFIQSNTQTATSISVSSGQSKCPKCPLQIPLCTTKNGSTDIKSYSISVILVSIIVSVIF